MAVVPPLTVGLIDTRVRSRVVNLSGILLSGKSSEMNTLLAASSTLTPAVTAWPEFRDTWKELHAQLPAPTAFLSVEWMDCWLSVFGSAEGTQLWSTRIEGLVVGAALFSSTTEWRGPVPVRCLYLNTAGEGEDSVTLEHNTVLCRAGYEGLVWHELRDSVQRLVWDELIVVGATADTAQHVRQFFPEQYIASRERGAPYMSLEQVRTHPDGMLGQLSRNTRAQLRRATRSATLRGAVRVEEGTTAETRRDIWNELAALHTGRWQKRAEPGAFSRARWRTFHQRLIERAPQETRLFRLVVNEETVATIYLLQLSGHAAFYQSGVRLPLGDSRDKPGLLIHSLLVEKLASEGCLEYDFLASDEQEIRYKRSLANSERVLSWMTVSRPTMRNRLVAVLRQMRARLRRA